MKRSLKNDIIRHLETKGNYDSDVDDFVIDILIENVEYSNLLKIRLIDEGLIVNIPNGNGIPTTKENPAFGTYKKCLDTINQCSSKLGINRSDRLKLKLLETKTSDGFDELMR